MTGPTPPRAVRTRVRALLGKTIVAGFLLASSIPAFGQAAAPKDFHIKLTSAARSNPADTASVEIAANGDAAVSAMQAKAGKLPATTLKLSPEALARIHKAMIEQRFFELKPLYEDRAIKDGDQAEISVTANGRSHTVRTVNISVFAFDRLTIAIDRELPIERRIQYNALRVPSYKGIER